MRNSAEKKRRSVDERGDSDKKRMHSVEERRKKARNISLYAERKKISSRLIGSIHINQYNLKRELENAAKVDASDKEKDLEAKKEKGLKIMEQCFTNLKAIWEKHFQEMHQKCEESTEEELDERISQQQALSEPVLYEEQSLEGRYSQDNTLLSANSFSDTTDSPFDSEILSLFSPQRNQNVPMFGEISSLYTTQRQELSLSLDFTTP